MTSRLTYFVSTESQPRVRRAADAVTVIIGVLLVSWGVFGIDRDTPWEQALTNLLTSLPGWASSLFSMGFVFGGLYGLGILVALVAGRRTRPGALRDVVLAALGAGSLGLILALAITGFWPYVLPEISLEDPVGRFPVMRVLLITAILVAASPHLTRPMRRLGWVTIFITAFAAIGMQLGDPSDAVGAFGIGLVAAGTVLLVAGSPRGYPDPAAVADDLRAFGLSLEDVQIDHEQSWGVRRFTGTSADGRPIVIKAYGRDASDSQTMAKLWRRLWYREVGATVGYSRLQSVDHEAIVMMLAERAGVNVPRVLAVGQASPEIALLAFSAPGRSLEELDPADISDDLLLDIWHDVSRLHEASLAHGSLTPRAIIVEGNDHTLVDFLFGSVTGGHGDRSRDVVELLFSLSLLIGVERAVNSAANALGVDALVVVLPYLQLAAIGTKTRKQAEKPKELMKELQTAVVTATGQPLPEPVQLRRVSGRNLLTSGLLVLAAWALIPLFTSIDWGEVWDELQNATWSLLLLAFVVGHTIFLAQASAMSFAVAAALPFWPVVILQNAAKFISLAIPGVAGRVAMNVAFLHKFGVSLTVAVAQGAVDGFSGFLVQCSILLIGFLSSDVTLDTDNVDVNWALILGLIVVGAVGAVFVVLRVRKVRERVIPVLQQGWGAFAAVLRQPSRAFGLFGSDLAYWLILGTTLWLCLHAIDVQLNYGAALVVAVSTDLLGGFVPIPGGIGVAEAVMTGFLVALGVDQSAAFAATICYRAITFYLPAVEGFFSLRWLERNEYL